MPTCRIRSYILMKPLFSAQKLEHLQNRREFIRLAGILAPGLLLGVNSCRSKPDLDLIKALNYPKMTTGIDLDISIDGLIKDISYTGNESQTTLLGKIIDQMQKDYEGSRIFDVNGWILSRTELVLLNLHLYD